ncbi:MAG: RagB/SusD family nutrient uptake outer membrane protein [Bacteroidota bacterium]|nr:RagB/SusD family nutrient uptake outer membrane protein [Bacteroidota bacterium]
MIKKYIVLLGITTCLLSSCEKDFLDRTMETSYSEEQAYNCYANIYSSGIGIYSYLPGGFNRLDGAFFAGASDEAEHTNTGSAIQRFNTGGWSPSYNPDDCWSSYYTGIRKATFFLRNSTDYKNIITNSMDTIGSNAVYKKNLSQIKYMRAEARFLRAFFYFELIKRYGGVPIVSKVLSLNDNLKLPRNTYDSCTNFIVSELDAVKDSVIVDWSSFDGTQTGRATKGAVLALKSRVLLYAASPLNNTSNDLTKWAKAAAAAREVIAMNKYGVYSNYQNLFLASQSYSANEVIMFRYYGNNNSVETACYPIGTSGGQSGTCPSQNLVDAYEHLAGWSAAAPYDKVDPRMQMTIAVNNSTWNSRTLQCYVGGTDGKGVTQASRTGYYLKKYIKDGLNLITGNTVVHAWIMFRYGEILLNYAEAMNEAYGPTTLPSGYTLTAVQAVNQIRQRTGVALPAIATTISQTDLREAIRRERRVELAFEEHRFWDVRRWKIAESTLGVPLTGAEITKNADGTFNYNYVKVEDRVFDSKMYYYPIPQDEINKNGNILVQNTGWK